MTGRHRARRDSADRLINGPLNALPALGAAISPRACSRKINKLIPCQAMTVPKMTCIGYGR